MSRVSPSHHSRFEAALLSILFIGIMGLAVLVTTS
ncbi:MAG: hypothetical protein RI958_460 [Actinomycetota bacterium]|jgi:hypothetical protein